MSPPQRRRSPVCLLGLVWEGDLWWEVLCNATNKPSPRRFLEGSGAGSGNGFGGGKELRWQRHMKPRPGYDLTGGYHARLVMRGLGDP